MRGPILLNVSMRELNGHKVYRSLRDVPEPVDIAAILVPAAHVSQAVDDCAATGVRAVVVNLTAGFGETGAEGKAEEAQLAARVRAGGGRKARPNSAGLFSAAGAVNLLGWSVPAGGIGLVTQSGNMALTFTNFARTKRAGFASMLAVGNVSRSQAVRGHRDFRWPTRPHDPCSSTAKVLQTVTGGASPAAPGAVPVFASR